MTGRITSQDLDKFFVSQKAAWPTASNAYKSLDNVIVRHLSDSLQVQFNEARAVSATAKVDRAAVSARPCFLCAANRDPQQQSLKCGDYELLLNPFPIFAPHFVLASVTHTPQRIDDSLRDLTTMAWNAGGHAVLYNGPRCGASAPDHKHLQLVRADYLPLTEYVDLRIDVETEAACSLVVGSLAPMIVLSGSPSDVAQMATDLFKTMSEGQTEEPDVNIVCYRRHTHIRMCVIPRRAHRPADYADTLLSPGAIDMAGVIIAVKREVFDNITADDVRRLYDEVGWSREDTHQLYERFTQ